MGPSIFRIGVINAGLFGITLFCFGLIGIGDTVNFNGSGLLILYTSAIILQIGINCLIFRKQIAHNSKAIVKIFLVVVMYYLLFAIL